MLAEGVPPAMIENAGRQAGMPVGPLSLNDEVALDLVRKIAAGGRGGPRRAPSIRAQKRPARRDGGRPAAGSAARTARASTTIPRRAPKRLWPGLAALQPSTLDPDAIDVDRAEAAPPGGAGPGGRRNGGGGRGHRSARGRCRLDPRLRLRAVHRRHAVLHRRHGRRPQFVLLCDDLAKKLRAALRSARPVLDMAKDHETFYGRFGAKAA